MRFKLFTLPSCPNCPAIKRFMELTKLAGEHIDASVQAGLDEAMKLGVKSTPTVLFFEDGTIVGRAQTIGEIKEFLGM
ncbi:hypothetical protein COY95_03185 [Candidatus Woesearchaeota archaeon CG_4_10_14_0_8_um_filter_47_5]|nr:MAG: hypothetical protein COY95_03185 [Candidatus Woesearchaeota archaeon CG_4_10_14_0_8_um_filter_47_5]